MSALEHSLRCAAYGAILGLGIATIFLAPWPHFLLGFLLEVGGGILLVERIGRFL